jgi:hypothetical protein
MSHQQAGQWGQAPQQYGPPTGQWGGPPSPPKKSKVVPVIIGIVAFVIVLGIIGAVAGGSKSDDRSNASPAATTAQAAAAPTTTAAAAKKKPAPPAKPASTVVLKESGHGIKSTVTFTVHGDWDLKYSYDCRSFGFSGNFIVQGDGLADLYVDELGKKGDDVTHLHDGGKMHLDINSECSWKIEVIDV